LTRVNATAITNAPASIESAAITTDSTGRSAQSARAMPSITESASPARKSQRALLRRTRRELEQVIASGIRIVWEPTSVCAGREE